MAGQMIEFAANGGTAQGYLAKPASGSGPGVIVVQEWWGLNQQIKGIADRLAAEGFVALAPDVYHGEIATNADDAGKLMMGLDVERAEKDLRGAATALRSNGATSQKVGAIGFCMGGQLALFAATASPDVSGVVDFYGIHPAFKPDYAKLQGPVLLLCGDQDPMAGPDPIRAIERDIKAAGKSAEVVVYPDCGHAFLNEMRPEAYKKDAADDAWSRMLRHLRENVR